MTFIWFQYRTFMSHSFLGTEKAEGEWITWVCTRTVLGRGKEPGS